MKTTVISILAAVLLIGGAFFFANSSGRSSTPEAQVNNVSIVEGKQIVDIGVKGGYSPKISTAKAEMPTTLRLKTNGTFDCSSAITIPALSYTSHLTPSGTTEVEVPPQKAGTSLQGVCAMGMYNFKINFN